MLLKIHVNALSDENILDIFLFKMTFLIETFKAVSIQDKAC